MKALEQVWQWKPVTRWLIIIGLSLSAVAVVVGLGTIPQPQAYHHFADTRVMLKVPNALDVLSNLPFIFVGALGLYSVARQCGLTAAQCWAYGTLFLGLILTGFGSGYYHLEPDNHRLVADRLPMTITMAGFMAALLVDRFGSKVLGLLPVLLIAGIGSVVQWNWSEQKGQGDLRWYGLYQGLTIIVGLLLLFLFPSKTVGTREFVIAAMTNVAAKLFELADKPIFHLSGFISGHTLKHLSAGLGFIPLVILFSKKITPKTQSNAKSRVASCGPRLDP